MPHTGFSPAALSSRSMNLHRHLPSLPLVALSALIIAATPGSAQVLLTASEYVLLAGAGVSAASGGSFQNGNVHGDTGTTGFAPVTVGGATVSGFTLSGAAAAVQPANTGVTTQAENDRITAHTALTNLVTPRPTS